MALINNYADALIARLDAQDPVKQQLNAEQREEAKRVLEIATRTTAGWLIAEHIIDYFMLKCSKLEARISKLETLVKVS